MDLIETDTSYIIKADVPGYQKDQIDVTSEGNVVTIHGQVKKESEGKEDDFVTRERFSESFSRSFALRGLEHDKIVAELKDGVLNVTVPKGEPLKSKIEINWIYKVPLKVEVYI